MKISRKTQFRLVFLALVIMAGSVVVYANFSLHVSSPANVNGATSATLSTATITFPSPNSTSVSCTVTGNTANCPTVQLTVGGSTNEAGNYTITVTFTANPVGDSVVVSCSTTGVLTCTPSNQTVFATGASQTASVFVRPGSTGSGNASVSVSG